MFVLLSKTRGGSTSRYRSSSGYMVTVWALVTSTLLASLISVGLAVSSRSSCSPVALSSEVLERGTDDEELVL